MSHLVTIANTGQPLFSVVNDESEHFVTCPDCGVTLDCRRLGDVLAHEESHATAGQLAASVAGGPRWKIR